MEGRIAEWVLALSMSRGDGQGGWRARVVWWHAPGALCSVRKDATEAVMWVLHVGENTT